MSLLLMDLRIIKAFPYDTINIKYCNPSYFRDETKPIVHYHWFALNYDNSTRTATKLTTVTVELCVTPTELKFCMVTPYKASKRTISYGIDSTLFNLYIKVLVGYCE